MTIQNLSIVRRLYSSLELSNTHSFDSFLNAENNELREQPWLIKGGTKNHFRNGQLIRQVPRFRFNGKQYKLYRMLIIHFLNGSVEKTRYQPQGSHDDMNPWNWKKAGTLLEAPHAPLDNLPARVSDEDISDLVDFIKESGSAKGLEEYYTTLEIDRAMEIIDSE